MLSEDHNVFTRDDLMLYLKELARTFRKLNGKRTPAEVILIGGASILINYGFRDMTTDVDAIIKASSAMKDAANRVGDKFDLPNGWLNSDFMHTDSYSDALNEISEYYCTYSNVLEIRTVTAEYLIAMKLKAGRKYKNDMSDIVGILAEHEKTGNLITMKKIHEAVVKLYGDWSNIPSGSREFIEDLIAKGNYQQLYDSVRSEEKLVQKELINFEESYPDTLRGSNIDDILRTLEARKDK